MNKNLLTLTAIIVWSCISFSCNNPNKSSKRFAAPDSTITQKNSFSELFLDSTKLVEYVSSNHIDSGRAEYLKGFYKSRNYQYAWINGDGLNEHANSFWNMFTGYINYSNDSSLFNKSLATNVAEFNEMDNKNAINTATILSTELGLTNLFYSYTQTAYAGKLDPTDLQWFIPRKKLDQLSLINSMFSSKIGELNKWEPVNPTFQALKSKLEEYNKIKENGGWTPIPVTDKMAIKMGDSSEVITAIKKRLLLLPENKELNENPIYDSTLYHAVLSAQKSFGYTTDGVIGKKLITALNIPVEQRVEQMLVNLERMRWLPETLDSNRIQVNIPEFVLHVFENGNEVMNMNIVVGKEGSKTVIFNDQLKYIVFSPYWNVPRSIVKNEIAPAMQRNSNYIARNNMEITGQSGGLPIVRQKPGPKNSLGLVKFLFPNNYNIYFHDTPSKGLFERDNRAFSHGCIRLAKPEELAKYLLRDDTTWTDDKIKESMHSSKEKWVNLKNPIPVYISYFTSWVDNEGVLNFRDDIYKHDAIMAKQLFIQPIIKADPIAKK